MPLRTWLWPAALAPALLVLAAGALLHAAAEDEVQHVSMTAMKFDYLPGRITVKKGKPVELKLSTLDRLHGFDAPLLGLHAQIDTGAPTVLRFTPQRAGVFGVHCDIFCGDGHEGMAGEIVVTD